MWLLPGSEPTSGFQDSGKDSSWESQKQPDLVRAASHTPEICGLWCVTSPILMVVIKRRLFVPRNRSRGGKDVFQWYHYSIIVRGWKEKTAGQKADLPWEDPAVLHHLWSLRRLMRKHLSPWWHGGRWKTGRDPGLFVFYFSEWKNAVKKKGGGWGGGETPVPGYTQLACWSQSFAWRRASAYFPGWSGNTNVKMLLTSGATELQSWACEISHTQLGSRCHSPLKCA